MIIQKKKKKKEAKIFIKNYILMNNIMLFGYSD